MNIRKMSIWVALLVVVLVIGLSIGGMQIFTSAKLFSWTTVANNGNTPPGSTKNFNSFNQPSVNDSGLVVFRARTQGGSSPIRGIFSLDTQSPGAPLVAIAETGGLVPDPNNSAGHFNEFPAFPRIAANSSMMATRGQSTPVWTYTVDGVDSKVGTSGIYALKGNALITGASLLGGVPGQEIYSVPGAPAGTRFDQFPGAAAADGNTIVFKGNYTEGTTGMTGDYFRNLSIAGQPIGLIANSHTRIPNQPADGTATFGSTAPPSAANGHTVFTAWDNETSPTLGGIYLAPTTNDPTLRTLVGIGDEVPGVSSPEHFTNFGEGLSFDGRYVGFWGSWGTDMQSITLTCPTDGSTSLVAFCNDTYPNGYTTQVPVHQGIFVYDTVTGHLNLITATGTRFSSFQYWVFSGQPPGSGSDEATLEPARWRVSSFVAVSGLDSGAFQVAFKATPVTGGSGIYVAQGPSNHERIVTAVDTTMTGDSIDPQAPSGSVVSTVGIERDGFRGRWLAVSASMLNPTTSEGWAGVYLAKVPGDIEVTPQTITVDSIPPERVNVGETYSVVASADSGLPVSYSIDSTTTNSACSVSGSIVHFDNAGTCVINITQSGDHTFGPAPSVQQTIIVNAVATSMSLSSPISSATYGQAVYVTASVSSTSGVPTGSVQFYVNGVVLGAPSALSNGTAKSPELADAAGHPLSPGTHAVTATFMPEDTARFVSSQASLPHLVNAATTALELSTQRATITARVVSASHSENVTGSVDFYLNGESIGSAPIDHGVAVLRYSIRSGQAKSIAAVFAGDARFTGSSASSSRVDPKIYATVTSSIRKTAYGWYRRPVTVRFRCVANGAPLARPCPSPVLFAHQGGAQSVSRSVYATDGGVHTVAVRNINIDLSRPSLKVTGILSNGIYLGPQPAPRCVAADKISGIASCKVTQKRSGTNIRYTVVARDRAGNTKTVYGNYRTLSFFLQNARYADGAFEVQTGHGYTLTVYSDVKPFYYDATPYPGTPYIPDIAMYPAGLHRWVVGITIANGMQVHQYWNIGITIGSTMHVVKVHVTS